MWTPLDVRDRFVEAAEVERRSPRGQWGPSQKLSFWPEYKATFEDKAGWGSQRLAEEREMRFRRLPPSPNEISRANEVLLEWTPLVREDRRKLVWFWAHCAAGGGKFAVVCRRMGWTRRTAYARLDVVFDCLTARFVNDRRILRLAGNVDDCTLSGPVRGNCCLLNELPEAQSPRSWSDGEASGYHPDIRDFSWAMDQAAREAKRRRKAEAGVPKPETV
jgi:hypothetical protein